MKEKWIYSDNEELSWFSEEFETKEQAIKCAKEDDSLENKYYIFVGRKVAPTIGSVNAESIIEDVAENTTFGLNDGVGEDFLWYVDSKHIDELEDKLNEVFLEWMYKHGYEPNWFEVVDVEKVEL